MPIYANVIQEEHNGNVKNIKVKENVLMLLINKLFSFMEKNKRKEEVNKTL